MAIIVDGKITFKTPRWVINLGYVYLLGVYPPIFDDIHIGVSVIHTFLYHIVDKYVVS